MKLDHAQFRELLDAYRELALLSPGECTEILSLFDPRHPLAQVLAASDSVHAHVRVEATDKLPRARVTALGGVTENEQPGYVKFAHVGGLNTIFSSIDIAEEDRIPAATKPPLPWLDHIGIDLRSLSPAVVATFGTVPAIASREAWVHVAQGGDGKVVYCCHTEVAGKHWLFPRGAAVTRPIEIASGPLKVHGGKMGCDLRPMDPAHPFAQQAAPCCGPREVAAVSVPMPGLRRDRTTSS
jgi:hypothetical protein